MYVFSGAENDATYGAYRNKITQTNNQKLRKNIVDLGYINDYINLPHIVHNKL